MACTEGPGFKGPKGSLILKILFDLSPYYGFL
jgi:hypothetical protein